MRVRLLYRGPHVPQDVPLGETCELEDGLARTLIDVGEVEALPAPEPPRRRARELAAGSPLAVIPSDTD